MSKKDKMMQLLFKQFGGKIGDLLTNQQILLLLCGITQNIPTKGVVESDVLCSFSTTIVTKWSTEISM